MAGANYMGGRRNFAKARSKDTAAKAQRNHFGKQKILSGGLCKPAVSSRDNQDPFSNPITRISLAHARQDPSIRRSQPQSDTRPSSFMVFSPPRSSVRTFRTLSAADHKRPNFLDYAARKTPPPGKRPSAILREVDLTEPLSFRAEMDRVRAIPDLAGLTQSYVTRRPSKRQHTELPEPSPQPFKSSGNGHTKAYKNDFLCSPFSKARIPEFDESPKPKPKRPPRYSPSWATMSTTSDAMFSSTTSDFEPMEFDDEQGRVETDELPDSGYAAANSPIKHLQMPLRNKTEAFTTLATEQEQDDFENTNDSDANNWNFERLTPSSLSPDVSSYGTSFPDNVDDKTLVDNPLTLSDPQPSECLGKRHRSSSHSSSSSNSLVEETLWDLTEGRLFESDADTWTTVKSRVLTDRAETLEIRSMAADDLPNLRFANDRRGVGYTNRSSLLREDSNFVEAGANSSQNLVDVQDPDETCQRSSIASHSHHPDHIAHSHPGRPARNQFLTTLITRVDPSYQSLQTPPRTQTSSLRDLIQGFGSTPVKQSDFDKVPLPDDVDTLLDHDLPYNEQASVQELLVSVTYMESPLKQHSPDNPAMKSYLLSPWSRKGSPSVYSSYEPLDANDQISRASAYGLSDSMSWDDSNLSTTSPSPSTTIVRSNTERRVSTNTFSTPGDTLKRQVVPGPALFSDFDDGSDVEE